MTQKQPLLISGLVTASLLGIAQNLTWEWLQSSTVSEEELESLQNAWAEIRIPSSLIPIWRMERATAMPYFGSPSYAIMTSASSMGMAPTLSSLPKSLDDILAMGSFFLWATIYRHADEKQFIENYQTLIDLAPSDPTAGPWSPVLAASKKMQTQLETAGIERLFSRMVLPTVETSASRLISTQAMAHLTETVLALQRYHLAHARYPEALAELIPAFLPAVPADPFDGNPLRYQRLPTGGYLLYAVGPDDTDDHGDSTKSSKRRGFLEGKDIVWPQAATP